MPRSTGTIHVKAIPGESFRFHVESWEDPAHPHLVDLLEKDGNGECDCWDFRKACTDNLKKHGGKVIAYGSRQRPNPDRTQCKHIEAALRHAVPRLFQRLSKQANTA